MLVHNLSYIPKTSMSAPVILVWMADCVVTKSIDTVAAVFQDTQATNARLVCKLLSWLKCQYSNANIKLYVTVSSCVLSSNHKRSLSIQSLIFSTVHPSSIRAGIHPSIRTPICCSSSHLSVSFLPALPPSTYPSSCTGSIPVYLRATLGHFVCFVLGPFSVPCLPSFPSIYSFIWLIFYFIHKQAMNSFEACLLTLYYTTCFFRYERVFQ